MSTPMQAFLRNHRAELLARWEVKVRASLPSEAALSHEQLQDSLPLFLDEIVEGLEQASGKLVDDKQSLVARVHGGQRQYLGRNIAELVREYGLFYEAVLEISTARGIALGQQAVLELSKCLFTGAAEAVEEFAEREEATRRDVDLKHFSFIAHELRTPLGSARLAWEAVRRRLAPDTNAVNVLSRSLTRLAEMIDETLASARLAELGRAPTAHLESIDVETMLREVVEDASGDADDKQLELRVEATTGLFVRGDPRLALSALTNIVRNAIKFTREGGTITVRSRSNGPRVLIEAQDQCGGLPPERAERLFEVFRQANQNRSGFGLGLAIAKQAVEAQGGTITVNNVPNSGCIFTLDLPANVPLP
jgi:signal transduction histidine kinase